MNVARIIVCERRGTWAVALRRWLREPGSLLRETRSLDECWDELSIAAASVVAVELTSNGVRPTLAWIERAARRFPDARFAALVERRLTDYEWVAREAGATIFVASPRGMGRAGLGSAVGQMRRHLAAAPPAPRTTVEQVLADLPHFRDP